MILRALYNQKLLHNKTIGRKYSYIKKPTVILKV